MTQRNETIVLAGKTYPFKTPKVAIVLSALLRSKSAADDLERSTILVTAQAEWLRSGIGAEAWEDVERRMMDDDDPLDWPDISAAFESAMSSDSARPTTSSPESSATSLPTTQAEAEPSRPASMFGL